MLNFSGHASPSGRPGGADRGPVGSSPNIFPQNYHSGVPLATGRRVRERALPPRSINQSFCAIPKSAKFGDRMKSIATLIAAFRRWLNREPELDEPGPGVRVPLSKGPGGRSAAAVVDPPE